MRTKLWPVEPEQPRGPDDPGLASGGGLAVQLRTAVRAERGRSVRLDVRRGLASVEDVVARVVDEWRSELGGVADAADVDRRRALRVVLGAVDVRPGGGVQHELEALERHREREAHVPELARHRHRLGERLGERGPQLAARAGDQSAAALSRSERSGDRVLQSSTTRGSSHGIPCSSGLAGSYSSVTR